MTTTVGLVGHVGESAVRHTCPRCGACVPPFEDRQQRDAGRAKHAAGETGQRARFLTPRECAVLDLLTEGLTDRQIARRLGISPRTVDTHLGRAYAKLGVQGRVAASTRWLARSAFAP